jgi:hypothetical protein
MNLSLRLTVVLLVKAVSSATLLILRRSSNNTSKPRLSRLVTNPQVAVLPTQADLCIVLGTSLQVQPLASLPGACKSGVPRVLINMERVGGLGSRSDDVLLPMERVHLSPGVVDLVDDLSDCMDDCQTARVNNNQKQQLRAGSGWRWFPCWLCLVGQRLECWDGKKMKK